MMDAARRDRVFRHAAVAQLTTVTYLELIEWVPMAPWNNLSRGNGQESLDIVIGVAGVSLAVATFARYRLAALAAIGAYGAWLLLQIQTWWRPYLFGADPQWARAYARWFAHNLRVLPAIGDHPVPDASHTVLHLLLVWSCVACWRASRTPVRHQIPD